MNNFSDYGMDLFIKNPNDGFIVLSSYRLTIYSEINKGGSSIILTSPPSIVISSGGTTGSTGSTDKIRYFKINSSLRAKSCELRKFSSQSQTYELVLTENLTTTEKTWS
jgi:hypothetical protein